MTEQLPEFLINPNPEVYRNGRGLVLDFETTNKDTGSALNGDNRLVLAVWTKCGVLKDWASDGRSFYHFGSEFEQSKLIRDIRRASFLVCHNAKFELQWLKRCGVNIEELLVYDTMVAEKVILGNRSLSLSLDAVTKRYGLVGKSALGASLVHGGVSAELVPKSVLLSYCAQDVELTLRTYYKQIQNLSDKLLAVVFTRCLLTPVLADIEANGMQLDKERVLAEYTQVYSRLQELEKQQVKLTGGINLNSPKQVGEFLYDKLGFAEVERFGKPDRTEKGGRRTDAEVYSLLKPRNKRQKEFLELKKEYTTINAAITKYLTKFKECVESPEDKGILKANFHQTNTANHRTSSTGAKYKIQFQNLDRKYKPLFRARHDVLDIVEVDGAQLEFRVAAFLGNDAKAKEDIRNEVDVHSITSKILTEAGQPTDRQVAKTHTFKPLYGGSSGTDAEKVYYEAFKARYNGIYTTQKEWVENVLKTKELETPWGLQFYWDDIKVSRSGYVNRNHEIFNYPVSSLATAEIIPIALVYLWHTLKAEEYQSFIVNTVHDSVIAEVVKSEQEGYLEIAKMCFGTRVYEYLERVYKLKFDKLLGIGYTVSKYWHEGKEVKINIL